MYKKSPLFQLMDLQMSGIMNEITVQDEDYQSLIQRSDECTDRLDALNLPEETRKLIDRYALSVHTGPPGTRWFPNLTGSPVKNKLE